jgi:hypothetical protein
MSSTAFYQSVIQAVWLNNAKKPFDDPPLLPVSWERLYDGWYNYVKGHNPSNYFGVYDVVRFDTLWLDK